MILAILLPVFSMNFSEYRYRQIDDSIAGPIKGRETVPLTLMTAHTSGFATYTTLIFWDISKRYFVLQLSSPSKKYYTFWIVV